MVACKQSMPAATPPPSSRCAPAKSTLNLPPAFTNRIQETLLSFDFRTLSPDVQKMFKSDVAMAGTHLVPDDDSYFDEIRSLVSTLDIDLNSL